MGRLLDPGVGELADRLSILGLKILHAPVETETAHWHQEQAQVQMRLDHHLQTHPHLPMTEIWDAMQVLQRENRQLWMCEDRMAGFAAAESQWPGEAPHVVARLGVEIWRHNRARNAAIQRINQLAGTDRGEEKL